LELGIFNLELGIFNLELGIFKLELGIFNLKILKAGPDKGRLELDMPKPELDIGKSGVRRLIAETGAVADGLLVTGIGFSLRAGRFAAAGQARDTPVCGGQHVMRYAKKVRARVPARTRQVSRISIY
jgi:hypothetical protein